MTDRPDIPEEGLDALARALCFYQKGVFWTEADPATKEAYRIAACTDRDVQIAVDSLRKQGAEEERRRERLGRLLGADWPTVTLMRDAGGGKSSPPWCWWMENDGYDHDKYEVEEYVPRRDFDQALAKGAEEERERLREVMARLDRFKPAAHADPRIRGFTTVRATDGKLLRRADALAALDTPAPSEREKCPRDSDWCDGKLCREKGIDCPNADPAPSEPREESR